MRRCDWARTEPNISYHDAEWGVATHDDQRLFEFLILEGAQAGLSWETVLKKRPAYRSAFSDFDPGAVARFGEREIKRLLADPGLIRNRAKIESAITNATAFLEVQAEYGSFDKYLWSFVGGRPIDGRRKSISEVPTHTPESIVLSKDLKRRGFKFIGPLICYSLMQAVGLVNDHLTYCFRYRQVKD